ncbi:hypothetical protein OKW34_007204 [Paraburkholderia youngii]
MRTDQTFRTVRALSESPARESHWTGRPSEPRPDERHRALSPSSRAWYLARLFSVLLSKLRAIHLIDGGEAKRVYYRKSMRVAICGVTPSGARPALLASPSPRAMCASAAIVLFLNTPSPGVVPGRNRWNATQTIHAAARSGAPPFRTRSQKWHATCSNGIASGSTRNEGATPLPALHRQTLRRRP